MFNEQQIEFVIPLNFILITLIMHNMCECNESSALFYQWSLIHTMLHIIIEADSEKESKYTRNHVRQKRAITMNECDKI